MDEISDLLADCSATGITGSGLPSTSAHPRFSGYKNNWKTLSNAAEIRRIRTLSRQKKRRDDFLSVARALVQGQHQLEDDLDDLTEDNDDMDVETIPIRKSYRNQLMLSEWLVDKPDNFRENWLFTLCPIGKRCLIVAGNGSTKTYARSGKFLFSFPSHLPGGKRAGRKSSSTTVLDAVYVRHVQTFFILDVLIWDDFSYYNCETDFRFYWIRTKMSEIPELEKKDKYNPYLFKCLEYFNCEEGHLKDAFNRDPGEVLGNEVDLDGILFYHKEGRYISGQTPLVGWLKGYMISEILGVEPVHPNLNVKKPANYFSLKNYISEKESRNKNEESIRESTSAME